MHPVGCESKAVSLNGSLVGVKRSGFTPSWVAQCSSEVRPELSVFCYGLRRQDFIQIHSWGVTPPCMCATL